MAADIANQVLLTERMMAHWTAILPPGRILRMRYEELVSQPEAAARRLLEHAQLPWEPAVLSFHDNQRAVLTASLSQVGLWPRGHHPPTCMKQLKASARAVSQQGSLPGDVGPAPCRS